MASDPSPQAQVPGPVGIFPATGMPDADWWHTLWPDPDAVVRALGVGPGMRVLDLACGDGHFTAALARCAGSGYVTGLDLDPALLARAKARCADPSCHFRLGDAMAIRDVCPGPFDVVFMANTFHGVPDKARLANAVAAVLAPGGRFVIINWQARAREETVVLGAPRGPQTALRLSPEATLEAISAAGFARERLVTLPPYHYGLIVHRPAAPDAKEAPAALR
ncbi:methyltransferase domain-containing protein [Acidiferrobacter sp.]|uniref:class I SAM-dependent methyltransferase n=1 Tax=Acidiferrobacter sp. TaxID=1872107 RepID=UPI0026302294|nr:methyltransferase domain-containing protein [Acidiferrobacter sp.]